MWDLSSRPGIEPTSPALEGGFLTTGPPGKSLCSFFKKNNISAIKRNEIELFVVRWLDLESVIQSEVSQKEKNKYRMLTHIYGI